MQINVKQNKLDGLVLAARFGVSPSALGLCGKEDSPAILAECITNTVNKTDRFSDKAEKELTTFKTLYPYLRAIGQLMRKDPFSAEVVRAYLFGTGLSENIDKKYKEILFTCFREIGVPLEYIAMLRKNSPTKFFPTHLYQVLLSHRIDGAGMDISRVNQCMLRWGKVRSIKGEDTLVAELYSIKESGLGLVKITEEVKYMRKFIPNVNKGSLIAVHWGWANIMITKDDAKSLTISTKRILSLYRDRKK